MSDILDNPGHPQFVFTRALKDLLVEDKDAVMILLNDMTRDLSPKNRLNCGWRAIHILTGGKVEDSLTEFYKDPAAGLRKYFSYLPENSPFEAVLAFILNIVHPVSTDGELQEVISPQQLCEALHLDPTQLNIAGFFAGEEDPIKDQLIHCAETFGCTINPERIPNPEITTACLEYAIALNEAGENFNRPSVHPAIEKVVPASSFLVFTRLVKDLHETQYSEDAKSLGRIFVEKAKAGNISHLLGTSLIAFSLILTPQLTAVGNPAGNPEWNPLEWLQSNFEVYTRKWFEILEPETEDGEIDAIYGVEFFITLSLMMANSLPHATDTDMCEITGLTPEELSEIEGKADCTRLFSRLEEITDLTFRKMEQWKEERLEALETGGRTPTATTRKKSDDIFNLSLKFNNIDWNRT